MSLKTTLMVSNLQHHVDKGILLDEFPRILRAAILFVRKIEIRFLWIDALCIIQDRDGGNDWAEQSAQMTDIYRGGVINLSALDGVDIDSGLFTADGNPDSFVLRIGAEVLPDGTKSNAIYIRHDVHLGHLRTGERPLSHRGSVFQE